MVDPKIMCRQHLLGEHAEIHLFIKTISRGNSVKGYLQKGFLENHNLYDHVGTTATIVSRLPR